MKASSQGLAIREARLGDERRAKEIVREAYGPYVPLIGREPEPMTVDYAALVRKGRVWIAETSSEVVGVLVLKTAGKVALLENVAVAPARQHQGIGRSLIGFAERRASELGFTEIRLYTNEVMTDNLRLYTALGYREVGRSVQSGFSRVFFMKRLDSPETLTGGP